MAERKPLFQDQTRGFHVEMATTDSITLGGLTMGGDIAMGDNQISGLPTPTDPDHAASKAYVDAVAQGLSPIEAVQVKTTAELTSYTASGSGVGKTLTAPDNGTSHNTIDGVLLEVGDRVLVTAQGGDDATDDVDNGVYSVTALGNGVDTSFELTRATDCDETSEFKQGTYVFVTEGTTNENTGWSCATDIVAVDTTANKWTQFSGAPGLTYDQGLSQTVNSIQVELDTAADAEGTGAAGGSSGLEFDADTAAGKLRVKVNPSGGIVREASGIGIDADSETGGNVQPVNLTANGVGLDINAIAGTGIEADGSANLRLATQGNGIGGGNGSTLSVTPDSTTGGDTVPVSVSANGVGLDVSSLAGDGLSTDTDGVIDIELEATNPSLQIVTDELGVKLSDGLTKDANGVAVNLDASGSALEFTGVAGDGTLGVKVDGSTITINGSNELVASGADEATRVENTWTTATDTVAVADPVYINGASTVGKAAANDDAKADVIGLIRSGAGAAPQSIETVSHGRMAGVLTGATAGAVYFLQATGGIGTSLPGGGDRVIQVGYALNATDLFVLIKDFAKRAA